MLLIKNEGKEPSSDDPCEKASGYDLLADVTALLEGDGMEEVEVKLKGEPILK
jgi:hypothetical protein